MTAAYSAMGKPSFFKSAAMTGYKMTLYCAIMASLGICHPKVANAGNVTPGSEEGKINTYVTPGGSVGVNSQTGEHVVFPGGGNVGTTRDGKIVVAPGHQSQQPTQPTFNYPTAQDYITQANDAYAKRDYRKMIDLSEEALLRINQGTLKATSDEIKKIEHRKDVGYEVIAK